MDYTFFWEMHGKSTAIDLRCNLHCEYSLCTREYVLACRGSSIGHPEVTIRGVTSCNHALTKTGSVPRFVVVVVGAELRKTLSGSQSYVLVTESHRCRTPPNSLHDRDKRVRSVGGVAQAGVVVRATLGLLRLH